MEYVLKLVSTQQCLLCESAGELI